MDIYECERRAKDDGAFDKATFDILGPNGAIKCRWLDAYFGLLQAEGQEGFWTVKDVAAIPGLSIENYSVSGVQS
jgi:hypothetical protein